MSNRLFSDDDRFEQQFDENFKAVTKLAKRGFLFGFAIIAVQVLVGLTVLGALGYVAYHFLSKVW